MRCTSVSKTWHFPRPHVALQNIILCFEPSDGVVMDQLRTQFQVLADQSLLDLPSSLLVLASPSLPPSMKENNGKGVIAALTRVLMADLAGSMLDSRGREPLQYLCHSSKSMQTEGACRSAQRCRIHIYSGVQCTCRGVAPGARRQC